MTNMLADARKRRDEKQVELENSGFVFEPAVNVGDLSIDEINDLLALEIGESTFTDQDIKRIA